MVQMHSHKITVEEKRPRKTHGLNVWPIHNEADYDRAADVVTQLAVQPEGSLSREDQDRLDIFTELLTAYDARHHRIDTSHLKPMDMIRYLMEQREMSASDLGRVLGNRQSGHDILSGRRALSKTHIRKLAEYFHLSPDVFL